MEKFDMMLNRSFDLPIAGRAKWKDGLRWQDYHEIIDDRIMSQIKMLTVFLATCIEGADEQSVEWAKERLWEIAGPAYDMLVGLEENFRNIFDMVVYMERQAIQVPMEGGG